jgi:uncharacterized phiE125 gp8 family phage protein
MEPLYSVEIVTPPAADPVTTEELYAHISLNDDPDDVEEFLLRAIKTATSDFEHESDGRVVVATVFNQFCPSWGRHCRPLRLVKCKASVVESVNYFDVNDEEQTLSTSDYAVDLTGSVGLVWLKDGKTWPVLSPARPRPVTVKYTAGWANPTVIPEDVKTGIMLLATHYYRNRGDESVEIPDGFRRLARKYCTGMVVC